MAPGRLQVPALPPIGPQHSVSPHWCLGVIQLPTVFHFKVGSHGLVWFGLLSFLGFVLSHFRLTERWKEWHIDTSILFTWIPVCPDSTVLHSHQQCTKIPVAPTASPAERVVSIPVSVNLIDTARYFSVALIFISSLMKLSIFLYI